MKIIKLFFLLTLGLWSDFELDIPNEVSIEQLQQIIKNGWNDKNETLNQFIIKHGEAVMPEAMQKMKKPLIRAESSKNDIFSTPKILLSRDDYFFILAYVKYLENEDKLDVALNTYIKIIEGLNNTNDDSLLNLILHITIEEMAVTALNESLNKNIFSQEMKLKLKSEINEFLILNTKDILIAFEGEKESILKAIAISLATKTSEKDASYEYKKYTSEAHEHWKKYTILYFDRVKTFMEQESPNPLKEFEIFIDKEKEEQVSLKNKILFFLSSLKAKIKNFLLIGNESYGFATQYVGKALALTSIPNMVSFYSDYLELIKKNEKLLSSL